MLMEPNGLGGGVYGGIGPGMLGLEMPLHQQQNPPNAPNPHSLHHPQLVAYPHHEADHHPQSQPPAKPGYAYAAKSKQQLNLSDDDEAGFNADDGAGDGKRKASSPWQRMKWTDTMVKLLIMAVLYIGDEGGSESNDPKKKPAGLLQKKGKWKSVSRAMMEKGYYVSPQQCEDKFNDLNKRYKRVNDILGKGTACRVVENQSLLEMMDLSPKMKEEVKKLLNSKHLFFREMCAYHSSCSHGPSGSGGASGTHPSPEVAVEPSNIQQQQQQVPQRGCFHSTGSAAGDHLGKTETEASKMVKGGSFEEESDEDEDEDSEDEDDDESDDDVGEGGLRGHSGQGHEDEHDYNESHKRPRKCLISLSTALVQQLSGEATSVTQDGNRSPSEKKQWMKAKLLQLEEQQVSYQLQAFELEKQRLKWVKFSGKKEREMVRAKLENERRRLENERMVLLVRQKELELLDLQQQQQHSSNKRSEPSSVTG